MDSFENAKTATEEMFENGEQQTLDDAIIMQESDEQVQASNENVETPTETEKTQEQTTTDNTALTEAVNTAEVVAQVAQEKDAHLQQVLQEMEALKAQNQAMQGTIAELSKKNEENIIEEAMQMPTLDINGLAFADEETVKKAEAEYARKMAEFVKGDVLKEVSPFVEQAKEGIYQKEKEELVSALSQDPMFSDIRDILPQLDHIISSNKWLQSDDMSMEEKYVNAYAIARGVNAINTPPEQPKELTSEELMELYDKNPTFQELVEKKRIEAIKNSQQVPPFSASSGAVNAALNIKEKPKSWDDASERTRKMFGLE